MILVKKRLTFTICLSSRLLFGPLFTKEGNMTKNSGIIVMVFLFVIFMNGICFAAPELGDPIRLLQILSGVSADLPDGIDDVDGDDRIGLAEAIYGLQRIAGLRQEASCDCQALAEPQGNTVTVSNMTELQNECNNANQGGKLTILIEDGTYQLSQMLYITADNVTFRGKSGNRDSIILKGNGMNGSVSHVFLVAGKNFTVADLTLGWIYYHGVQVQGEKDADGFLAHNVRFVDTNEQMLKVSGSTLTGFTGDNGIVECCLFEYTAGIGPQYYIGGVDCHLGRNWIVRNNVFKHIRSPEENLAEHAIHFWNSAENTLVENNVIINCDRGIGFGLGSSRHIGGTIRNNMIHTTRDVGIGLESASNVSVYHNTVYTQNYSNSIEYRFSATSGGEIANNLTNATIAKRNDGAANVHHNYTSAAADFFFDPTNGDMHLVAPTPGVTDAGAEISSVSKDFDCQDRPSGLAPDFGADELEADLRF
jgi:hypothetical protein